MFQNTLHLINHREKMLKSFNNNSPFSMENLLSTGKISPENLEINISDKSQEDEHGLKYSQDLKSSLSPAETTRSESENDRLSPNSEKNELFLRFNNCFKNRICSNCGRLECNFLQCRISSDSLIKDTKPILKFSVSAILGDEHHQQQRNSQQNGKKQDFSTIFLLFLLFYGFWATFFNNHRL